MDLYSICACHPCAGAMLIFSVYDPCICICPEGQQGRTAKQDRYSHQYDHNRIFRSFSDLIFPLIDFAKYFIHTCAFLAEKNDVLFLQYKVHICYNCRFNTMRIPSGPLHWGCM